MTRQRPLREPARIADRGKAISGWRVGTLMLVARFLPARPPREGFER